MNDKRRMQHEDSNDIKIHAKNRANWQCNNENSKQKQNDPTTRMTIQNYYFKKKNVWISEKESRKNEQTGITYNMQYLCLPSARVRTKQEIILRWTCECSAFRRQPFQLTSSLQSWIRCRWRADDGVRQLDGSIAAIRQIPNQINQSRNMYGIQKI